MSERKKYRIDGDKLKAARKRAALTVEELSEKANEAYSKGFSISDIQKYEKGDTFIYADKLKIFASILNVRPEDIIFFDVPGPLTDTLQYKTWRNFIEDVFTSYIDRYHGLCLYKNYMSIVFDYCGQSWDALSAASSIDTKGENKKAPGKHNAIYSSTRNNGLKKKDFLFTNNILIALVAKKDEAMLLVTENRHIAEMFRRKLSKHLEIIKVLKEEIATGKIEYRLPEIEQLSEYFTTLSKSLEYAEFCARNEKQQELSDNYGNGDWAAYQEELQDQVMYSELDEL